MQDRVVAKDILNFQVSDVLAYVRHIRQHTACREGAATIKIAVTADHGVGGKADQDAALQDRVESVGEAHGSKGTAQRPDELARSGR